MTLENTKFQLTLWETVYQHRLLIEDISKIAIFKEFHKNISKYPVIFCKLYAHYLKQSAGETAMDKMNKMKVDTSLATPTFLTKFRIICIEAQLIKLNELYFKSLIEPIKLLDLKEKEQIFCAMVETFPLFEFNILQKINLPLTDLLISCLKIRPTVLNDLPNEYLNLLFKKDRDITNDENNMINRFLDCLSLTKLTEILPHLKEQFYEQCVTILIHHIYEDGLTINFNDNNLISIVSQDIPANIYEIQLSDNYKNNFLKFTYESYYNSYDISLKEDETAIDHAPKRKLKENNAGMEEEKNHQKQKKPN